MTDAPKRQKPHNSPAKGVGRGGPAKGPGWGGPARGAHPARSLADRNAIWNALSLAERKERMAATKVRRYLDSEEVLDCVFEAVKAYPQQVAANATAFFRLSGQMPPERVESSGPGGGPQFVLIGAPEAKDTAEWVKMHTPK